MITSLAFFGAFNPPTRAHIELADFVRKQLGFDKVVFVPSKERYIEGDQQKNFAFTDEERLNMLNRIAKAHSWMEVSDLDITAEVQPKSYTSLCKLREETGYAFKFLLGSDKLPELEHGWKFIDEICHEFGFVCMTRVGTDPASFIHEDPYLSKLEQYFTVVVTPDEYHGISSTEIRKKFEMAQNLLNEIGNTVPEELDRLLPYIDHKE